jgi:hypothetical protein
LPEEFGGALDVGGLVGVEMEGMGHWAGSGVQNVMVMVASRRRGDWSDSSYQLSVCQ